MQYYEMKNATVIVAKADAMVSCVSPDGEILWTEGLKAGRYAARQWQELMHPTDTLELEGSCTAFIAGVGRVSRQSFGEGSHESGANPDFHVTSATRAQRELERTMSLLTSKTDRLDRQLATLNNMAARSAVPLKVERAEPVEVIDDEPDTEPSEEPAIDEQS